MLHTTDTQQRFGDGDTKGRFIDLFVRKNRDGKLGHINYEYFGDYIDFKEMEWNDQLKRYEEVYQDKLTHKTFSDELNEMDLNFN